MIAGAALAFRTVAVRRATRCAPHAGWTGAGDLLTDRRRRGVGRAIGVAGARMLNGNARAAAHQSAEGRAGRRAAIRGAPTRTAVGATGAAAPAVAAGRRSAVAACRRAAVAAVAACPVATGPRAARTNAAGPRAAGPLPRGSTLPSRGLARATTDSEKSDQTERRDRANSHACPLSKTRTTLLSSGNANRAVRAVRNLRPAAIFVVHTRAGWRGDLAALDQTLYHEECASCLLYFSPLSPRFPRAATLRTSAPPVPHRPKGATTASRVTRRSPAATARRAARPLARRWSAPKGRSATRCPAAPSPA
jgi:hypothetical protein